MTRSRNHHYVPRWLLRRFCFSGSTLYYYSRLEQEKGVQERNIRTVFRGFHLNSVRFRTGQVDDSLERVFYAELDDRAARFVEDVERALTHGREPYVTSDGRPFVAQLIYNQFKRSREFFETIGFFKDTKAALEQAVASYEDQFGPISEKKRAAFFNKMAVQEHTDYVRTRVLAHQGDEVISVLSDLTPVFGTSPQKKQFVVSGLPVAILPNSAAPHGREYWMPISPSIAIGLVGPTAVNRNHRVFPLNAQQVRRLNVALTAQSESFAGKSQELVSSLARRR